MLFHKEIAAVGGLIQVQSSDLEARVYFKGILKRLTGFCFLPVLAIDHTQVVPSFGILRLTKINALGFFVLSTLLISKCQQKVPPGGIGITFQLLDSLRYTQI